MNKKYAMFLSVLVLAFLLIAGSAIYSKYKLNTSIANQSAQTKGNVQSKYFQLKDLNGKSVNLSDYKGKIVILNFWATWCPYCVQEMPDLNELNKNLQKEDNAVILAIDVQESKDTVKKFIDSNKISLPVLLDNDGSVTKSYGITGFPTTYVINKDGAVFTSIVGATNKETLENILSKIK